MKSNPEKNAVNDCYMIRNKVIYKKKKNKTKKTRPTHVIII